MVFTSLKGNCAHRDVDVNVSLTSVRAERLDTIKTHGSVQVIQTLGQTQLTTCTCMGVACSSPALYSPGENTLGLKCPESLHESTLTGLGAGVPEGITASCHIHVAAPVMEKTLSELLPCRGI